MVLEGIAISFNPLMGGPAVGVPLIAAGAALSLFGGVMGAVANPGHTAGDPVDPSKASGSSSGTANGEAFGPEDIIEKEVGTTVNIHVQGDILDSDQTGQRLVGLINDAFNNQGVVIEQGVA